MIIPGSIIALLVVAASAHECIPREFGEGKIVCVCNATYCDTTPDAGKPESGTYHAYLSSKSGDRLKLSKGKFSSNLEYNEIETVILVVDSNATYQSIVGWGGAFTDSVGINVNKLSPASRENLLKSYFDAEGSRYNLGRIPIGGTDFSTRGYTYDDVKNDKSLKHFTLAKEDLEDKIPLIRRAIELSPDIRFVASPWTAPGWMKTNGQLQGFGTLQRKFYQTYANYLLKFLEEYDKKGVKIWALTTGNEPSNGFIPIKGINAMGWTPSRVANWVAENLGPTLDKSIYNKTLILALDDQRFELPWYIDKMFLNKKAKNYVDGIAVHWYWDRLFKPVVLDLTHKHYPDKFLIETEACTGSNIFDYPKVDLGSWERGEQYILNIIENVEHWTTGWIDWNIALDVKGGPTWIHNNVDSPIIVIPENDEFYKQPMYYALKHFSRFVSRGSKRISITNTRNIKTMAFATPDEEIIVVLYNKHNTVKYVAIKDLKRGIIHLELPPYSISTIIYSQ